MKKLSKKIFLLCLTALLCVSSVLLCSCKNDSTEDIVKEFDSCEQAAQSVGLDELAFAPEGYKAVSFRSYYDIVLEVEFWPEDQKEDEKNKKTVIFRAMNAQYTVSNLSGYIDTALKEQYVPDYGDETILFSIEGRDEFLVTEWKGFYGDKICDMSLSMGYGSIDEMKHIIDSFAAYLGGAE